MISLLPFWALNVSVVLLSVQGQKALRFHQKYLNLFSKDEWKIMKDKVIFGQTIPLMHPC